MNLFQNRKLTFAAAALATGATLGGLQACDAVDNLREQCGLVCPAEGLAQGNASISGVASVDAFFSAVLSVRDASLNVKSSVRGEIEAMALSLGVDVSGMALTDAAAAVQGAISAKLQANVEGSLTISYQPPKCEASLEVAVEAAAECDVQADPGSIEAKCEGSCAVDADVAAMCQAEGTLRCEGQAPNFMCSGTCSGTCQLEAAATCEGSCSGTCEGTCTACAGGNCETDGNGNVTNCAGSCEGMCTGSCELSAGGSCSGRCEGSCEYDPGGVECEANATAKCEASANVDVECSGSCEGEVTPPEVSAECEASVDAKAKAEVVCTPPSLNVDFQFAAGLDADGRAEFKAWLSGFKTRFAALLAAQAKLEFVAQAAAGAAGAATGAVRGAVDASLSGDLDLKVTVGLGCALDELETVGTVISGVTADVQASTSAVVMIGGAVGGSGDYEPFRYDVFAMEPVNRPAN